MPKFVFTFSDISEEDEEVLGELFNSDDDDAGDHDELQDKYNVRVYDGTDYEYYSLGLNLPSPGVYYYIEKKSYVDIGDDAASIIHEKDFKKFKRDHLRSGRE